MVQLLSAGVLACAVMVGASAQEPANNPVALTHAFTFAWPVPSSVVITKDGEKQGKSEQFERNDFTFDWNGAPAVNR